MKIKISKIAVLLLCISILTLNFRSAFGVIDVGVTAIISPACPTVAGIPDSVIVVISNIGSDTVFNLNVWYALASVLINEPWAGSLAPSSSDTFAFATQFIVPYGSFAFCS